MTAVAILLAQGSGTPPPPAGVTWSPTDRAAGLSLSGGDLTVTKGFPTDVYAALRATHGRPASDPSGFYFEVLVVGSATSPFIAIGVANTSQLLTNYIGSGANGWSYYQQTGTKITNGAGVAYGAAYTTGDVIGVLLRAGELEFFKNGASQGVAFTGLTGDLYPAAALYRASSPAHVLTGRFKAADLTGSIPAGASAWES